MTERQDDGLETAEPTDTGAELRALADMHLRETRHAHALLAELEANLNTERQARQEAEELYKSAHRIAEEAYIEVRKARHLADGLTVLSNTMRDLACRRREALAEARHEIAELKERLTSKDGHIHAGNNAIGGQEDESCSA